MRRGAVEAEDAGARFAGNRVGLKTLPVRRIHDKDLLVRENLRLFQVVDINFKAALIVEIAVSESCTVNFSF